MCYGFDVNSLLCSNKHSEQLSRPFDVNRTGIILGEGSGLYLIEDYEIAMKRNAPIYAEVIGTANSFNPNMNHKPSIIKAFEKTMKDVLIDAKINKDEINVIFSSANSSIKGDGAELSAIDNLFKEEVFIGFYD